MPEWKVIDNELTNTGFNNIPELFETSAPDALWTVENEVLTQPFKVQVPELFETSAPAAMWRVEGNEGLTIGTPYPPELGAFCHASRLKKAIIPSSCKKIGRYAFRYTQLRNVNLAADCEYWSTSFPPGCNVVGGIMVDEPLYYITSDGYRYVTSDGRAYALRRL